jgi:hypothetical protein
VIGWGRFSYSNKRYEEGVELGLSLVAAVVKFCEYRLTIALTPAAW